MTANLYHVTRRRDADRIFQDGLRRESTSPAKKEADELRGEADGDHIMYEESPSEQAERWFDEVIRDAKRSVPAAEKFPAHQPAVFFWPTEQAAFQSNKSVNWGSVLVGVDGEKLPSDCRCAIAPVDGIDVIFKHYYDVARDHGMMEPEEQFERAKEWWQEVQWYEGQNLRRHEVWCPCNVPPHAIEWIHDPRDDRRLYEPPAESQSRLLDFAP